MAAAGALPHTTQSGSWRQVWLARFGAACPIQIEARNEINSKFAPEDLAGRPSETLAPQFRPVPCRLSNTTRRRRPLQIGLAHPQEQSLRRIPVKACVSRNPPEAPTSA